MADRVAPPSLDNLTAISPLDGRYWNPKLCYLSPFFSEFSLMKYRVRVEIEYFIALCQFGVPNLKEFSDSDFVKMRDIYLHFNHNDAQHIWEIEDKTKHDVKAVEYFIKEKFDEVPLWKTHREFVHFALTSQDLNDLANPLSLREALHDVVLPALREQVVQPLRRLAIETLQVPMLSRVQGLPDTPTRLGKELMVYLERLMGQLEMLKGVAWEAKFGGTTGGFCAHEVAFPGGIGGRSWMQFADGFVASLGLRRSQFTTQIGHYDHLAALFDNLARINTILTDMCRDLWQYVSLGYFAQKVVSSEVGSSTMPHKINPVALENAEGNLQVAHALYAFLSSKLPISRMQRDLTDVTVVKNIGVALGHSLLAFHSIGRGFGRIGVNEARINKDLDDHWEVVLEGLESVLVREGRADQLQRLYDHPIFTGTTTPTTPITTPAATPTPSSSSTSTITTTGPQDQAASSPLPLPASSSSSVPRRTITRQHIQQVIDSLDISDDLKQELSQITPFNFTGTIPLAVPLTGD